MKQTSKLTAAKRSVALILALLLTAGTLTGCTAAAATAIIGGIAAATAGSLVVVGGTELAVAAHLEGKRNKAAAAANRKPTFNEHFYGVHPNPLPNEVEDRLLRRTSTLAGGTPVDVTPYLFHEDSFAVVNDEVWYNSSIIDIDRTTNEVRGWGGDSVFEFDITVTYQANNQNYKADLTAVSYHKGLVHQSRMTKPIAEKYGLDPKTIKKLKVKINKTRKGTAPFPFTFNNVFLEEIEPCYYDFDVDVEFRKLKGKLFQNEQLTQYATFTKVYRSNLQTLEAAAIDVQMQIWEDAIKAGYKGINYNECTPLPRVNFVRVAKFTN